MTTPTVWVSQTRITDEQAARNTQLVHGRLRAALGDDGRVLWAMPTKHVLIVQATTPLPRDGLRGLTGPAVTAERPTSYPPGTRLAYSGILNPTRARATTHGARGAVSPLPIEDVPQWLARKLDGAAHLDRIEVEELGHRRGTRMGARITHRMVGVAGIMTVTDTDRLTSLLTSGIGRGKAYGAGLILTHAGGAL